MDELETAKAQQVLGDMGFKEYDRVDDIVALIHSPNPSSPYPLILDISQPTVPKKDIYEQFDAAGVDIEIFEQLYNDLG